jgi:hypothetical protein
MAQVLVVEGTESGSASAEQPVLDGKNGRIDLAGREAFGRGAQPWGVANAIVLLASELRFLPSPAR